MHLLFQVAQSFSVAKTAVLKHKKSFIKLALPESFVEHNRHCVGQVMAAGVLARHGYGKELVFVTLIEICGQAMPFISEHHPVPGLELQLIDAAAGLGAAEKHTSRLCLLQEVCPAVIHHPVQIRPVIQSSPAEVRLIQLESQRSNQMQPGIGTDAKAPDSSGILGDFRCDQHDIEAHGHRTSNYLSGRLPAGSTYLLSLTGTGMKKR